MFRLNFAPRLMLAMLLLVTLVAASLFAVTRKSLEAAWQEVLQTRFLSQMESLASLQKARLDSIGWKCQELAASPEVLQALNAGVAALPEEIHADLLERARVVRESASSFENQNSRRGPPGGPGSVRGGGPPGGFRSSAGPSWLPESLRFRNDSPANSSPGAPPERPAPSRTGDPSRPDARRGDPTAGTADMGPAGRVPPSEGGAPSPDANLRNEGNFRRGSRGNPRWVRPDWLDLALMDASGKVTSVRSSPEAGGSPGWLGDQSMGRVPEVQEVVYMTAPPPEGGRRFSGPILREVIITPVFRDGDDRPDGALLVGLPVSTYGETALYDLNRRDKPGDLYTGLWIGDQLFSRSIPREAVEQISARVRARLQSQGGAGSEQDIVEIDGKPWQLLCRNLNPDLPESQAWRVSLYSLEGLAEQRQQLRHRTFGFAGLGLGVSTMLCWWVSRRMVLPVRALVAGTRRISQGDYETRVPVTTRDELATLAGAFNEMAAGLKQRQQYRDILFQVSDDDIARQLIETACLGGERREISVLFCDIREFTATTNGMPPEEVIDLLNEHMTALTEVVHQHHGVVDKFVGDLIMAIFGAPKSYGDDAGNAAACALDMMERRASLNQTTAHPPLLMGIGIASGTAVAGCMGSEHRLNYTVLGEPVNLASRLCSAAGPREIIVDPGTVDLLRGRAQGHWLRPLRLKGFPSPITPWHLSGISGPPPATDWPPEPGPDSSEDRDRVLSEAEVIPKNPPAVV